MTEDADDILNLLPARLKHARRAQGLSLEAVSNLSGVSRSMISQIERGESSPTISTLWNLTRALQVDFAGLLEAETRDDTIDVLRARETPTIDNMGHGCRIRILSLPEDANRHEVYELDLQAGGRLPSQPHARRTVESLTVISGRIELSSGVAAETLGPGDTARYAADVPHSITAPNEPARAFLIVKSG